MTVRDSWTHCRLRSDLFAFLGLLAVAPSQPRADLSHQLPHVPALVIARDIGMQIFPGALNTVVIGAIRRQRV